MCFRGSLRPLIGAISRSRRGLNFTLFGNGYFDTTLLLNADNMLKFTDMLLKGKSTPQNLKTGG